MQRKVIQDGKVISAESVILVEIDSSSLAAIGYSTISEKFFVRFKSTPLEVWAYHQVPFELWVSMQNAESKGKFFYEHIKGKFKAEKIIEEQEPKT